MKINQLFVKHVDEAMITAILRCFNIHDLEDKRMFCKYDMVEHGTVKKLTELKDQLAAYYIPCKSRLYLENLTEKRAITVLKQVLRLYNFCLWSKEKNHKNKKIIFYQVIHEDDPKDVHNMRQEHANNVISFDG